LQLLTSAAFVKLQFDSIIFSALYNLHSNTTNVDFFASYKIIPEKLTIVKVDRTGTSTNR